MVTADEIPIFELSCQLARLRNTGLYGHHYERATFKELMGIQLSNSRGCPCHGQCNLSQLSLKATNLLVNQLQVSHNYRPVTYQRQWKCKVGLCCSLVLLIITLVLNGYSVLVLTLNFADQARFGISYLLHNTDAYNEHFNDKMSVTFFIKCFTQRL